MRSNHECVDVEILVLGVEWVPAAVGDALELPNQMDEVNAPDVRNRVLTIGRKDVILVLCCVC